MNSILHPIRWYRRRQWRKKVMALPWEAMAIVGLYEGDSAYYQQGVATDEEYAQVLEVIGARSERVDALLKICGYWP